MRPLRWFRHAAGRTIPLRPKRIANRAIRMVRRRLRKHGTGHLQMAVRDVFWYGAVDLSPANCTVWVILRGQDSERLQDPPAKMEAHVLDWLRATRAVILDEFRNAGWPRDWPTPAIGFESHERIQNSWAKGSYWDNFH